MTLVNLFHHTHYRKIELYYLEYVLPHLCGDFPGLVSYPCFVDFYPSALIPLCTYFKLTCLDDYTGISFAESTSPDICLNRRFDSHKFFARAIRSWKIFQLLVFGIKLPPLIYDCGELLNITLLPAKIDDRKPIPRLVRFLRGAVFGDEKHISKPLQNFFRQIVEVFFIAMFNSNSKNRLPMIWVDRIILRQRASVYVIDQPETFSRSSILASAVFQLLGKFGLHSHRLCLSTHESISRS